MVNQLLNANNEISRKMEEIFELRYENESLTNELTCEKNTNERMKILEQSMRKIDKQLRGQ